MAAVEQIALPLWDAAGQESGLLTIALLPMSNPNGTPPLLDFRGQVQHDHTIAPVQLLEGAEYRYVLSGLGKAVVQIDPVEVFQPDTREGLTGRIRPGLFTGSMQVTIRQSDAQVGRLDLEIRSRKLNYLDEYRWMLENIADQMTELVMDRFAVSASHFVIDEPRDAVTLYQRFAFLRALISRESFQVAINEIIRHPHVAWEEFNEVVRPGQAMKGNAKTVRQLTRQGSRAPWPGGPIASIPDRLERARTEATHDTTPNRFVRFALERWRQVVGETEQVLLTDASKNPALQRGLLEVSQVLAQLDEVMHHDLFRELGHLLRFPADDQVLHKREGYRDVFRAYLEFELAARLSWQGGESVYGAGQRDVATLYEYWVFLQLAQTVADLLGSTFDLTKLIELRDDGLNVVLHTGKETVLSGDVVRHGRKLKVELCFNRTFGGGKAAMHQGSWSQAMRPDYSLIISPADAEPAAFEPVLVHFDAKYRVHMLTDLFGNEDGGDGAQGERLAVKRTGPLRTDVLKMHAYRDAIRRSAGAYVLYPGEDAGKDYQEYHELLPGLGAFVLRPTAHGPAAGVPILKRFLSDVLDHVATQLTAHERSRDDLAKTYNMSAFSSSAAQARLMEQPPAITSVLLGWVKSREHWAWINRHQSYNVRAPGRSGGHEMEAPLLYSQLLLLYGPDGLSPKLARIVSDPILVKEIGMSGNGYPDPRGDYLCVGIKWIEQVDWLQGVSSAQLMQMASGMGMGMGMLPGAPVAVLWDQIKKCKGVVEG